MEIFYLFVAGCVIYSLLSIFKAMIPKYKNCYACGSLTNKSRQMCSICGALMEDSLQNDLIAVRKIRNDLIDFRNKNILSDEAYAAIDQFYGNKNNQILEELGSELFAKKEIAKEEIVRKEEEQAVKIGEETGYKIDDIPVVEEKHKVEPEEIEKTKEIDVHAEETPDISEKEQVSVKWSEKVIKSLLYVGVFGLLSTVALVLYNNRESIPDFVKFSILFILTACAFFSGYLLKYKFNFERTGVSLIYLGALLIPMNYLSAKIYHLVPARHTCLEWFGVALFCAVVYAVIARLMKDQGFLYLSGISGFISIALAMRHMEVSTISQCQFMLLPVFLLFSGGYVAHKKQNEFYRDPLNHLSIGIGGVSTAVFTSFLQGLLSSNSYMPIALYSAEVAVLLMFASMLYGVENMMFPAVISLLMAIFSFEQVIFGVHYDACVKIVLPCFILLGLAYILRINQEQNFAKPFYLVSYVFSFIGIIFAGTNMVVDSRFTIINFVLLIVYFAVAEIYVKEETNIYLLLVFAYAILFQVVKHTAIAISEKYDIMLLPAFIFIGAAYAYKSKDKQYYSLPLRNMSAVIAVFLSCDYLVYLLNGIYRPFDYLDIFIYGTELSVLLIIISAVFDRPKVMYIAGTIMIGSILSVLQYYSTGKLDSSIGLYITCYIVGVLGFITKYLKKYKYAEPLLLVSYVFSFICLVFLGYGFVNHGGYIWLGIVMAGVYHGFAAYYLKSQPNVYLVMFCIMAVAADYFGFGCNSYDCLSLFYLLMAAVIIYPRYKKLPEYISLPCYFVSHFITFITAACFTVYAVVENGVSWDLVAVMYGMSVINCVMYSVLETRTLARFEGMYSFIGGVFANIGVMVFCYFNKISLAQIGLVLMAPAFIYLLAANALKKYQQHYTSFNVLITVTALAANCMAMDSQIITVYTLFMSIVLFALASEKFTNIFYNYMSLVTASVFLVDLLDYLRTPEEVIGFYFLGYAMILFVISKLWAKKDEIVVLKNPFYSYGILLTIVVPLYKILGDSYRFSKHLNTTILVFIVVSIIYGTLSRMLKRQYFTYISILTFGAAYGMVLRKFDVSIFNYGIWFLVMGISVIGLGRLTQQQGGKSTENPFYMIGLGITLLVMMSLVAAGKWYFYSQINIAIIATIVCAFIYSILSYLTKDKRLLFLSMLTFLGAYYLTLKKYHVTLVECYTIIPALIIAGYGVREKIRDMRGFIVSSSAKITIGMWLYFLPAIYKTLSPLAIMEGFIVGVSSLVVFIYAVRIRIKNLFVYGITIFTLNIAIQAFHYIKFGAVPKSVWIGTASVICIFIGFLGEKRFNAIVKSKINQAKTSIKEYFEDWK